MRIRYIAMAFVLGTALVAGCSDDKKSDTTSGGGVTVPAESGTQVLVVAGDTSETEQFLTADPVSVSAGSITFSFQNTGNREHEMVILKTDTAVDALEIVGDRVSEDDAVGEIGETEAGVTASQTFDLDAGNYLLVCNIEKHYGQGMAVAFTVTG
ncbi:MAG: cupredoxin domain-containing protein [Actinobacteria bacterium]|nr:cupredoxin domain-containing protein [Actinomycetota bacterium]